MDFPNDIDFIVIDNEEDFVIENNARVPRRYVRDGVNPFENYNEDEFKRRFRFGKDVVRFGILPLIEVGLAKPNNLGLPIPPIFQLLVALRFYATASFQLSLGDTAPISQPTVSRIVFRISTLLASLLRTKIKMPSSAEVRFENRQLFQRLGYGNGAIGIPGVDGAIDCTHIRLVHTRFHNIDEVFRNRKGYFSLNVQTVVGPRMEFLDIVPEWPGSAQDSRIFQNSRIYARYLRGSLDGLLVGDAGYPCLPFLMTPIQNPQTSEQQMYNIIQVRTRQIVERTYGVWKRRFPCLSRGMTTKLVCSTAIVVACAVLHNLALQFNDVLAEEDEVDAVEAIPAIAPDYQPEDGPVARDALIERMFR